MSDISTCLGKNCPENKENCYRYVAYKDHMQSYVDPMIMDSGCSDYWPLRDDVKLFFEGR